MNIGMENYGKPKHDGVTHTWDLIQSNFKCCGVTNMTDWKDKLEGNYPDSCCVSGIVEGCGKTQNPAQDLFGVGCFTKFTDFFSHNLNYVGSKTTFCLTLVSTPIFQSPPSVWPPPRFWCSVSPAAWARRWAPRPSTSEEIASVECLSV